jgi:hypothetical protein
VLVRERDKRTTNVESEVVREGYVVDVVVLVGEGGLIASVLPGSAIDNEFVSVNARCKTNGSTPSQRIMIVTL